MGWFRFTICRIEELQGIPLIVSRTGYTGELGYEIWCHPKHAPEVWDKLMAAGKDEGLIPAGFAAFMQTPADMHWRGARKPTISLRKTHICDVSKAMFTPKITEMLHLLHSKHPRWDGLEGQWPPSLPFSLILLEFF